MTRTDPPFPSSTSPSSPLPAAKRRGAASLRAQLLAVDEFGNIANWPEGFFGDEIGDLVARAEAQARRTREGAH